MTQLKSGWIETGTNTPTGAAMQIAVDNPYVSKDEFIASAEGIGLGLDANSTIYTNGELDKKLLQASSIVNRYCRRYFDSQTVDEQYTRFRVKPMNPQLLTVVLRNRPYTKINSIYIQVLKWFIEVDVTATGYLQDFYQDGYYKIVPLLSLAGTGAGSPIPSQIIDNAPLGVLWTNYTFGFGTPLTSQTLSSVGSTSSRQYQAPLGNRLWAPDQTTTIYDGGTAVATSDYTIDYPNGSVTFNSSYTVTGAVTADFTSNDSMPYDLKEATILVAANLIGQGTANPFGATTQSIQTYSTGWSGGNTMIENRFKELLEPYVDKRPVILN